MCIFFIFTQKIQNLLTSPEIAIPHLDTVFYLQQVFKWNTLYHKVVSLNDEIFILLITEYLHAGFQVQVMVN